MYSDLNDGVHMCVQCTLNVLHCLYCYYYYNERQSIVIYYNVLIHTNLMYYVYQVHCTYIVHRNTKSSYDHHTMIETFSFKSLFI